MVEDHSLSNNISDLGMIGVSTLLLGNIVTFLTQTKIGTELDDLGAKGIQNIRQIPTKIRQHLGTLLRELQKENELSDELRVHPRIFYHFYEKAPLITDSIIAECWTQLFLTSADEEGRNQDNLVYMNLLTHMTPQEVRLLDYCCYNATVSLPDAKTTFDGTDRACDIDSESIGPPYKDLVDIPGFRDIMDVDRSVQLLLSARLIYLIELRHWSPYVVPWYQRSSVKFVPSSFGFKFYLRCKGDKRSIREVAEA